MPEIDPLQEPQRIAFAGDWHANTDWALGAIRHAAGHGADVIVHCGDFGYDYRRPYLQALTRALDTARMRLLFVDGNHEQFPRLEAFPLAARGLRRVTSHIWHVTRGYRWNWGGIRFLACGGAHSVDRPWRTPQASWWPQETITPAQVEDCVKGGLTDVLISHDCPAGVPIPGLSANAHLWQPQELAAAATHRLVLREISDATRPRMIWHGHYHVNYLAETHELPHPCRVRGLDCDGINLSLNLEYMTLAELRDYLEEEPVESVVAAFEAGVKRRTVAPPGYDWADDPNVGAEEVLTRFLQLPPAQTAADPPDSVVRQLLTDPLENDD